MSSRSRAVLLGLTALGTIVLAVVFASRFGSDPRLSPSPLIDAPVPDATVALVDEGRDLSLASLDGEILVINFWAPWCIPCRAEHADLVTLSESYGELGITVVGIAYQSREADVVGFLDELGRGYPIGMDDRSRAAIGFGVRGVPETYFVDRSGTVVAKISGPIDLGLASATLDRMLVGDPVDSVTTGEVQTSG